MDDQDCIVGKDFMIEENRCIKDLLRVYHDPKMYINEKGYMQKLIDNLYHLGYYEDNESIFLE